MPFGFCAPHLGVRFKTDFFEERDLQTVAIVQARLKSERLPRKVMREVLGRPLISFLLERLSQSKKISKIVLATSDDSSNDPLADYVSSQGFSVYRGSENDVLDRVYKAALAFNPEVVVRTTADSPLMDYKHVDQVIDYLKDHDFDYVSSGAKAPMFPDGLDTEVFKFSALERAWKEATLKSDREHVTAYIKRAAGVKIGDFLAPQDFSKERFTVDNPEDFEVVKYILENLYQSNRYFDLYEILDFKYKNPDFFKVNQHLARNEGYQKSLSQD